MSKKSKFFLISLCILISTYFSVFIWSQIELPYTNNKIVGAYSKNHYNSLNDFVRYLVFLASPIFIYLLLNFFIDKNFIFKIKYFFSYNQEKTFYKYSKLLKIFFLIIFSYLLLEFFSIDFPVHEIDSYHDGQRLSSAFKSLLDKSLWSGSYVTRGIFYETISTKWLWTFFDHISIGLARYVEIINILILKISLIFLSFLLSRLSHQNSINQNLFFLLSSFILLSLSNYNVTDTGIISYRDIPTIFLLILFVLNVMSGYNFFILFLISSISLFSTFYGIDRGVVCNLLIFLISIDLIFHKKFIRFIILLLSISIFWLIFFLIDTNEFYFFISNTKSIISDMGYIFGIIHPVPFTSEVNSTRASKTLIFILFSVLISLSLVFNKDKHFSLELKRVLFFLGIICVLNYVHALGRSDGPHIKSGLGFPVIFFSFFILKVLFDKISKYNLTVIKIFFSLVIFSISLYFFSNINFQNSFSFKERLNNYIYLEDEYFLNDELKIRINKLNDVIINEDCIDLFTYDAAVLYLTRKPSCSKFYYTYSIGSKFNEAQFISDLKKKNNQLIITTGQLDYWDPINKKYQLLYSYIQDNYFVYKDVGYKVMKKK
jgi:hypothetical protein